MNVNTSGGIENLIESSEKLVALFGAWPCFHDAEVIALQLWRGHIWPGDWDDRNVFPVLTVKIRVLEATQPGANHAGDDVLVTFRFHDVDDFKVHDFNHVNQIVGMSVAKRDRGKFTTGEDLPPDLLVTFEPGFGMGGSFRCRRIEVAAAERDAPGLKDLSRP